MQEAHARLWKNRKKSRESKEQLHVWKQKRKKTEVLHKKNIFVRQHLKYLHLQQSVPQNYKGCFSDHFQALVACGGRTTIIISPHHLYLALGTEKLQVVSQVFSCKKKNMPVFRAGYQNALVVTPYVHRKICHCIKAHPEYFCYF